MFIEAEYAYNARTLLDRWRKIMAHKRIALTLVIIILLALPGAASAKRLALVIGLGDYQNSEIEKLRFARADAAAVYDYLVNPKIGGFNPEDVKLLIDEKATLNNLLAAFAYIQDNAAKDDMVFIYFAGHGAPEFDREYEHADGYTKYIIPFDADPNSLFTTAIATDRLENVFSKIQAECLVFVMDSCYSGGMGGRTFAKKISGRSLRVMADPTKNLANKAYGKGRVVITAAQSNQVAQEADGHGLFTAAFLEALEGKGDGDGDGNVTLDELYKYVYKKVARLTKNKQHPQKSGDITGEIILASATQGFVFEPGPDPGMGFAVSGRRWATPKWTAASISVVGLAASAALYMTAQNNYEAYQGANENDKERLEQDTIDYYQYTYVAGGVTVLAAGASAVFFYLDHKDQNQSARAWTPTLYVSHEGAPMAGVNLRW